MVFYYFKDAQRVIQITGPQASCGKPTGFEKWNNISKTWENYPINPEFELTWDIETRDRCDGTCKYHRSLEEKS